MENEPKQETLEEAAIENNKHNWKDTISAFIEGAKWQAERMYSKEEVLVILESFNNGLSHEEQLSDKAILSHLEQFKKK